MILDPEYFDLKTDKLIPVDEFVEKFFITQMLVITQKNSIWE